MRHKQSEYMHWAKTQSHARFNLATSGVGAFPLGELGGLPPLEMNGDNSYGYAPLKQANAERYAGDADCVVTAAGTSGANYLAFATLLDAGDEVLVEHPAYGLLVDALEYVGAVVKRFARTPEGEHTGDEAHRGDEPAQSFERADGGKRAVRDRRDRAQRGRAGAGGRGLPGCGVREYAANVVSPGRGVRGDQQFDQGVRGERAALWVDSGGSGTGARHVADERRLRGHAGTSGGTAKRGGVRATGCGQAAVPADCGGGPEGAGGVPGSHAGGERGADEVGDHFVFASGARGGGRISGEAAGGA